MIHYHGLPITPDTCAIEAVAGGHALVSAAIKQQLGLALNVCQSVMFDNGAFLAWASGKPISDWQPYYRWIESLARHPSFAFAIIPDIIDGDEDANDELLDQWPLGHIGAPVWHMHESITRLRRLCLTYSRVCIGSSGDYKVVGNAAWWVRMEQAMDAICDSRGFPICKLHGLRMLNPKVFTRLPFASADSSNIGRNIGLDTKWKSGAYPPPTKEARARLMRTRIENYNGAERWDWGL